MYRVELKKLYTIAHNRGLCFLKKAITKTFFLSRTNTPHMACPAGGCQAAWQLGFLSASSVANCSMSKNSSPKTLAQTNASHPSVARRKSLVQVPYSANSQAWPNLLETRKEFWEIGQDPGCHCHSSQFWFQNSFEIVTQWSKCIQQCLAMCHNTRNTLQNCVCMLLAFWLHVASFLV